MELELELVILVQVVPPFVEDSHPITLPECPLRYNVPLAEGHSVILVTTGVAGGCEMVTTPPTEAEFMVIVPFKAAFTHGPDVVIV